METEKIEQINGLVEQLMKGIDEASLKISRIVLNTARMQNDLDKLSELLEELKKEIK